MKSMSHHIFLHFTWIFVYYKYTTLILYKSPDQQVSPYIYKNHVFSALHLYIGKIENFKIPIYFSGFFST